MSGNEKMATNLGIRGGLDAIREILGDNGAKILFRNVGLVHIYENPPEYNWEPCLTIAEQASIYSEVGKSCGAKRCSWYLAKDRVYYNRLC